MAYTIILVDKIAEAQVDDLSDNEFATLMEIYEVLRLVPENGMILRGKASQTAMYVFAHRGIEVVYLIVASTVQVAIVRVNRLPDVV
ncbi:hypothetical protein [Streptosporangium sp. NBC_01756]|uniref:hypothetical protein n=1 Tax=Streptosporangium sp. NBC_01756 TaxID=2975950 RepID=UPI002DD90300|nr:hypothetical protein [Streptosporangium sp. NBC_01756]WSC89164.1 hypothetical protein OIE48_13540 [Streptosporangium sp. NBC_01756]